MTDAALGDGEPLAGKPAALFLARIWKPAALALFLLWLLVVGAHHEPWFDEAQAWLLARDLGLRELLVDALRYEGTPPLWHLVLWGAIRCGLPYGLVFLLPVACVGAAAAVILWRAPFPPVLRLLSIAGYYPAYQYGVLARGYALTLLLVIAAAALFAERTRRPIVWGGLIGLLAETNAHGFLFAAVLGGEFLLALARDGALRSSRRAWIGLALALTGGFTAAAVAWPPSDGIFLEVAGGTPPMAVVVGLVREAFVDRPDFWSVDPPTEEAMRLGLIASVLLLVPAVSAFRRAGILAMVGVLFAVEIGFSAVTYAGHWHAGLIWLIWFFGVWVSWPALADVPRIRRLVVAAMVVGGVSQAVETVNSGIRDVVATYSPAAAAADLVAEALRRDPSAKVAGFGFRSLALQPWFDRNVFADHRGGEPRAAAMSWKRSAGDLPVAPTTAADAFGSGADVLVVSVSSIGEEAVSAYEAEARRTGRVVTRLSGGMIWRGRVFEDESLLVVLPAAGGGR